VRQRDLLSAEASAHGDAKVEAWLDLTELRALDQAVEGRRDLSASQRFGAVVILPAEDRPARGPLGSVVVERDRGVVDKENEPMPNADHVADRLVQSILRQDERRGLPEPRDDVAHDLS